MRSAIFYVSGKIRVLPGSGNSFIAQPSLSQVLKEAEEEVGFKIFQRDGGGERSKSGAEL